MVRALAKGEVARIGKPTDEEIAHARRELAEALPKVRETVAAAGVPMSRRWHPPAPQLGGNLAGEAVGATGGCLRARDQLVDPSLLAISGVAAGSPPANSAKNDRFTNSGAPRMYAA